MSLTRYEDSWLKLDPLFEQAMRLPPNQREAFCRNACIDDDELLEMLLKLITAVVPEDKDLQFSVSAVADDMASGKTLVGSPVGAYNIEKLLARGGMGEVYLASRADGEFEKEVVVKVISLRLLRDEFVRYFKAERQVLAKLNHPFIPTLIDAGQLEDGRPYLITEFIDGIAIDEFCDQNRLSQNLRISLIEKLGQAVSHAHANLVLHLDIKPANVLVETDGTPRLLDFGVARLMSDPETGHRAYTVNYASPEQLKGDLPSAASDIYSLGVLAYRLLLGETPFQAPRDAPLETKMAERNTLVLNVSRAESIDGLDADLCAILRKAMAESASERYATIDALLSDVRRYRMHLPVSARPATWIYKLRKYTRRHWVSLSVAAAIVALLSTIAVREYQLRENAQIAYAQSEEDASTLRQVSAFLIDLFEVSDPGESRGNTVTARELLDRGADRISNDLADQPEVATKMMNVMGSVHVKLGLYDEAATLFENSLQMRQSTGADENLELADTLTSLGDIYRRKALFKQAEPVLLRGLAIREEAAGPDHPTVAESLRMLGHLYMREGRYDEAEQHHKRGLAILDRSLGDTHPDYADHLSGLAMVYMEQGRNEEAESRYLSAIEILERAWGSDHPDLANYLESLANLYNVTMQRYDDAKVYYLRSLALREKALPSDHPLLAMSYVNYAALLMHTSELNDAQEYLHRALAIQKKNFTMDDWRIATIQNNLGEIYYQRENFADAQAFASAALKSFTANLRSDHPFIGYSSRLLANIYLKQDLSDEAAPHFEKAMTIFESLPVDDPNRLELADEYQAFLQGRGLQSN